MLEDAAHGVRLAQEREEVACATAVLADQDVDCEYALHELGPRVALSFRALGLFGPDRGAARFVVVCVGWRRHHAVAIRRRRSEDPVVGREMHARPGHQCKGCEDARTRTGPKARSASISITRAPTACGDSAVEEGAQLRSTSAPHFLSFRRYDLLGS